MVGEVKNDGWIYSNTKTTLAELRISYKRRLARLIPPPSLPPIHPYDPLREAQLAIKRVPVRFPAQEPLQRLHLVLTAPLLQHQVPIPPALGPVHGVLFKHGVEHVGAVDLGGEVAVVAGVVAAEEVAEGGLAVAC